MSESELGRHGPRLGICEVCDVRAAIYTCPKCEVKTCCLECVRVHKIELHCDGVRDKTKFIRLKDFTDRDYLQDYQMLEECARFVFAVKRDEKKRYTRIDKELPLHLLKLKMAARERGIALQFLAQNFTRHQSNTTRYDYKSHLIRWRVEWIFANAEPALKMVDTKCLETMKLGELLNKYLGDDSTVEGASALAPYKGVGFPGIKVLMRAEKLKGCVHKFFELDLDESLAECLSGKCVVEFPTFIVVYKDHAYNFEIITGYDVVKIEQNLETSFQDLIQYVILFNIHTASYSMDARLKKQQYFNKLVSLTKTALRNWRSGLRDSNLSAGTMPTAEPQASTTAEPDSKTLALKAEETDSYDSIFIRGLQRSMEHFSNLQKLMFQSRLIQLVAEMKFGPQTLPLSMPSTCRHSPEVTPNYYNAHYCDSQPEEFDTL